MMTSCLCPNTDIPEDVTDSCSWTTCRYHGGTLDCTNGYSQTSDCDNGKPPPPPPFHVQWEGFRPEPPPIPPRPPCARGEVRNWRGHCEEGGEIFSANQLPSVQDCDCDMSAQCARRNGEIHGNMGSDDWSCLKYPVSKSSGRHKCYRYCMIESAWEYGGYWRPVVGTGANFCRCCVAPGPPFPNPSPPPPPPPPKKLIPAQNLLRTACKAVQCVDSFTSVGKGVKNLKAGVKASKVTAEVVKEGMKAVKGGARAFGGSCADAAAGVVDVYTTIKDEGFDGWVEEEFVDNAVVNELGRRQLESGQYRSARYWPPWPGALHMDEHLDRPGSPRNVTLKEAQAACTLDNECAGFSYEQSIWTHTPDMYVFAHFKGRGSEAGAPCNGDLHWVSHLKPQLLSDQVISTYVHPLRAFASQVSQWFTTLISEGTKSKHFLQAAKRVHLKRSNREKEVSILSKFLGISAQTANFTLHQTEALLQDQRLSMFLNEDDELTRHRRRLVNPIGLVSLGCDAFEALTHCLNQDKINWNIEDKECLQKSLGVVLGVVTLGWLDGDDLGLLIDAVKWFRGDDIKDCMETASGRVCYKYAGKPISTGRGQQQCDTGNYY